MRRNSKGSLFCKRSERYEKGRRRLKIVLSQVLGDASPMAQTKRPPQNSASQRQNRPWDSFEYDGDDFDGTQFHGYADVHCTRSGVKVSKKQGTASATTKRPTGSMRAYLEARRNGAQLSSPACERVNADTVATSMPVTGRTKFNDQFLDTLTSKERMRFDQFDSRHVSWSRGPLKRFLYGQLGHDWVVVKQSLIKRVGDAYPDREEMVSALERLVLEQVQIGPDGTIYDLRWHKPVCRFFVDGQGKLRALPHQPARKDKSLDLFGRPTFQQYVIDGERVIKLDCGDELQDQRLIDSRERLVKIEGTWFWVYLEPVPVGKTETYLSVVDGQPYTVLTLPTRSGKMPQDVILKEQAVEDPRAITTNYCHGKPVAGNYSVSLFVHCWGGKFYATRKLQLSSEELRRYALCNTRS